MQSSYLVLLNSGIIIIRYSVWGISIEAILYMFIAHKWLVHPFWGLWCFVKKFHFFSLHVVFSYKDHRTNFSQTCLKGPPYTFTEEPQDFRFVHCPEIKITISYFYKKKKYLFLLKMNGLFLIHFYNLRFFMQFAFLHFLDNIIIYFAIFCYFF